VDMDGLKRQAAARALEHVQDGMKLGLGTGSTARHFVELLGQRVAGGLRVVGVPTSEATRAQAEACKIPLTTLDEVDRLDLTVDGADEVDGALNLIKGGGGALLREKIVAQRTKTLIIIADAGKRVARLGTRGPVPVEVAQFAHEVSARILASHGCRPVLRMKGSDPYVTDNANFIYDCHFDGGIPDPRALHDALCEPAGIIDSGLFLGMAKIALIAADDGTVETLRR